MPTPSANINENNGPVSLPVPPLIPPVLSQRHSSDPTVSCKARGGPRSHAADTETTSTTSTSLRYGFGVGSTSSRRPPHFQRRGARGRTRARGRARAVRPPLLLRRTAGARRSASDSHRQSDVSVAGLRDQRTSRTAHSSRPLQNSQGRCTTRSMVAVDSVTLQSIGIATRHYIIIFSEF